MKDIYEIDENFRFNTNIDIPGIHFYDVLNSPFSIHGLIYENGAFRRMPEKVAEAVNDGVYGLHTNTAGGRVRFRTDSPYIAIHAEMPDARLMSHCALTGSACFDLYVREEDGKEWFVEVYKRKVDNRGSYEGILYPNGTGVREYTINFPTYSPVSELYIGLDTGAVLESPQPYAVTKPVVYYGSSITQGGCASRSGSTYQSIVSRQLDCDYVNLGFAGSAKGEQVMAEYIAGLDMSVFVCDYDHNAPSVEHLAQTHAPFFQTVRRSHPNIPIVMMSRPLYRLKGDAGPRLEVIRQTYDAARQAGDQNVYLLEGPELMALAGDNGLVDCAHPNDLGFYSMAMALGKLMKRLL